MIERPICVYAVFAKNYEVVSDGINLDSVTCHPSGFAFDLKDDESELGDFGRRLIIGILADPGAYEIVVKHAESDWEHRGRFTIEVGEGESSTYVVPDPIRFVVLSEKLLNNYSIFVNDEQVGKAYLYWSPVRT